ncbi:MAG: hypothetical protein Kow0056_00110 [Coriobacteriia bacterium]
MIDCDQAKQLLSERFDARLGDEAAIEAALEHCESCEDCAAFARALAALDAMPRPQAPDATVRAALLAVEEERKTEEEAAARFEVYQPPEEQRRLGFGFSAPRPLLIAGAAVVFVAAVFITVRLMTAGLEPQTEGVTDTAPSFTFETPQSGPAAPETQQRADEGGAAQQQREAPPFVQHGGYVYTVDAEITSLPTSLTPVGTVLTSKDLDNAPLPVPVYEDPSGALYLEGSGEGAFMPMQLVTRNYNGTVYALTTDSPIESFGEWPTLPSYIPAPMGENGGPSYVEEGVDSAGVTVYTVLGRTAQDGIAVPPNTPSTDPAAGNPNWTWWTPR